MTRFVIALVQLAGIVLIVAAIAQWSVWLALAVVGAILVLGAAGYERATLDR